MAKRILYAIPALCLLFTLVYFHGLYAQLLLAGVTVACTHEMMSALKGCARPMRGVGYAYAALIFPAYAFAGGFAGVLGLLVLGVMAVLSVLVLSERDAPDGLMTALCMLYPGLFCAFMIALVAAPPPAASRFLLIIAFGAAVATDTFAYLAGRLFGRHKLLPAVSPKKTVEGAVGGLLFGTAAVAALGISLQAAFGVNIRPLWYVALGFGLSVMTQMGDLAASYIKRRFGIKDFGHIMGEHGGVLDRLDSVLFICPAVFAFYLLIAA